MIVFSGNAAIAKSAFSMEIWIGIGTQGRTQYRDRLLQDRKPNPMELKNESSIAFQSRNAWRYLLSLRAYYWNLGGEKGWHLTSKNHFIDTSKMGNRERKA
ncbi:MAG: hypothetical protein M3Y08_19775 [Fibrobacterota bacterium]|nr:hypothetical protein [Fibrobacterota bacterium]